jgi:hypothetical protein
VGVVPKTPPPLAVEGEQSAFPSWQQAAGAYKIMKEEKTTKQNNNNNNNNNNNTSTN